MLLRNCLLALAITLPAGAQTGGAAKPDLDPLALKVLKAVTDPIRDSKAYSFRALVSRERLGTNGQIITSFREELITLARPDKLRVDVNGAQHNVQVLFDAGHSVIYEPERKLYATVPSAKTIDAALDALEKRDVSLPMANLLVSDPYKSFVDGLTGAYVIGKTKVFDTPVHQLAFTEKGAEWQLWVDAADKHLPRRLEIVYTSEQHQPRITVEFRDWNLAANAEPALFSFNKPEGARQIEFLKTGSEK
jgi:hypothetical protein